MTSAQGAAIHDVIEVTGRRFPGIPLLLAATRVQGDGAEEEIAAALEALQRVAEVDVILLVRGGGSLEDLQPYNTERVARALRACRVPVVSGVGHEVDVTIADLAADLRAPTPSAAAALAVPERAAPRGALEPRHEPAPRRRRAPRLRAPRATATPRAHEALRAHAPHRAAARAAGAPRGGAARALAAARAARRRAAHCRACAPAAARLDALSPLAVLGRGYAIAQRATSGAIVRRASQVGARRRAAHPPRRGRARGGRHRAPRAVAQQLRRALISKRFSRSAV